jgi:hypothetical protein
VTLLEQKFNFLVILGDFLEAGLCSQTMVDYFFGHQTTPNMNFWSGHATAGFGKI